MKPGAPITLARLERCMDTLCRIMASQDPADAAKLTPLYLRLERDIEDRRATNDVLAAARTRALKRSPDRTSTPSS